MQKPMCDCSFDKVIFFVYPLFWQERLKFFKDTHFSVLSVGWS